MRAKLVGLCAVLVSVFTIALPAGAQDLCEAIVRNAMDQVSQVCADVSNNNACYGFEGLSSTFVTQGEVDFSAPGSLVDLPVIQTVQSTALDTDLDEWGVGLFRVLLDDPEIDSAVVIMMMGDVALENAVTTANTGSGAAATEPIPVTTAIEIGLLDTPGAGATSITTLPEFTVALADAVSDDGAFVRVDAEGETGWLPVGAVVDNPLIADLPPASQLAEPVPVTTASATDIFSDPSAEAEVAASAGEFEVLFATQLNADGTFAQVEGGWVPVEALVPSPLLDDLPTQGGGGGEALDLPPMRALYFETGGASACPLAPNRVLLQTPQGAPVNMQINDIPVRVGSTVTFGTELFQNQEVIYIHTIDGTATLYPGTPDEVVINEGFVSYAPLDVAQRAVAADFSEPGQIDINGEGFFDLGYYSTEVLVPQNVMNYPVEIDGLVNEQRCTLTPREGVTTINGQVGPGQGRSVRTFLELDQTYTAAETVEADGATWYGIDTDAFGRVYADASNFTEDCVTTVREVRTQCILDVGPDVGQVGGYTGPADNRTIVLFVQDDAPFSPVNREVEADGDVWFEIPYPAAGRETLWVKGENFANLEGCDDLSDEGGPAPQPTPAPAGEDPANGGAPSTGGDFIVTLTSCQAGDNVYVQTWEISGVPEVANNIVFEGNTSNSVGVDAATVTVRDSSGSVFAYANTASGLVEAEEVYNVGCSGLGTVDTTAPTPSLSPSLAPTAIAPTNAAPLGVPTSPPPTSPAPTDAPSTSACSPSNTGEVNVNFVNQSGAAVDLYWYDTNCNLVYYQTIDGGSTVPQVTFGGHEWAYLDPNTGDVLAYFVASGSSGEYFYGP